MAATKTVSQIPESPQPRQGIVTLFGYGINVRVDRGHLLVEDGIGAERRQTRFARVGHGLKRLVVIGSDGLGFPRRPALVGGSGCSLCHAGA